METPYPDSQNSLGKEVLNKRICRQLSSPKRDSDITQLLGVPTPSFPGDPQSPADSHLASLPLSFPLVLLTPGFLFCFGFFRLGLILVHKFLGNGYMCKP